MRLPVTSVETGLAQCELFSRSKPPGLSLCIDFSTKVTGWRAHVKKQPKITPCFLITQTKHQLLQGTRVGGFRQCFITGCAVLWSSGSGIFLTSPESKRHDLQRDRPQLELHGLHQHLRGEVTASSPCSSILAVFWGTGWSLAEKEQTLPEIHVRPVRTSSKPPWGSDKGATKHPAKFYWPQTVISLLTFRQLVAYWSL